jgi:hypothetical protein
MINLLAIVLNDLPSILLINKVLLNRVAFFNFCIMIYTDIAFIDKCYVSNFSADF